MKIWIAIGLATFALFCAMWLGARSDSRAAGRCDHCHVILISIDTLRADHLGSYGYSRPTSPNLDEFAKEAVRFETAIAQAPSTAASHGAIFTSQLPSTHGALFARRAMLSAEHRTIAEILKEKGFRTASFNGGGQLSDAFGFARGFERYESIAGSEGLNDSFRDQVQAATRWLDEIRGQRFFLFLHTYEVHIPYGPKPEHLAVLRDKYEGTLPPVISSRLIDRINAGRHKVNDEDRQFIVDSYDAEIRSVDEAFGDFVRYLRANNLFKTSTIIVTSDHGEEFGEHGKVGVHSYSLYDELLKVPLIIKFPHQARASETVTTQVRSLDILPTVLDVLQLPPEPRQQGHSLLELMEGSASENDFQYALSQKDSKRELPLSVRTSEWKLNRKRLFDLEGDPGELRDVSAEHPEVREGLERAGRRLVEAVPAAQSGTTNLKPNAIEQLKTLGYLN